MSLSKKEAEEILELCLKSESPMMQTKVHDVLNKSGIQPNDPMFLVLALTGQMRVFLEDAPAELKELLLAWKFQNAESINQLSEAIAEVKQAQEQQIEKIRQSIEEINSEGIDRLRVLHKALLGEILTANTEIEQKIQDTTLELIQIQSEIKTDRETNIKLMKSLIEGVGKTNGDLIKLNSQIQKSISSWEKARVKGIKKWIIPSVAILSGFSMILMGVIGLNFLETPKSEQSSLIIPGYRKT